MKTFKTNKFGAKNDLIKKNLQIFFEFSSLTEVVFVFKKVGCDVHLCRCRIQTGRIFSCSKGTIKVGRIGFILGFKTCV